MRATLPAGLLAVFVSVILIMSFYPPDVTVDTPVDTSADDIISTSSDSLSEPTNFSFLALGDSYTIGQGVNVSERWPSQLIDQLTGYNMMINSSLIMASTGWTTWDLLYTMENSVDLLDPPYDLVSLLIGVNDQYRRSSVENFPDQLYKLIDEALLLTGNRPESLILLTIPDYGVTPFGGSGAYPQISEEIDAYNLVIRNIASRSGIHFFDITEISRMALDDPTLLADDGLHPSGKMYGMWVDEILPYVISHLTDVSDARG
ncbi:MAG: SGNH/GDSL hydrolase family protein [Candidatus Kariarchaeaceae archaeon]